MPFVVIGIVVLIVLWVSKSDPQRSQTKAVATTPKQTKPNTTGRTNAGIEALLKDLATSFAKNAYDSEAAQTFATVGFSLAISVALAVNIGIGIIIFVIVEWVAYFIDWGAIFSDAGENKQAEGIAAYWKRHGDMKRRFKDGVTNAAATENRKVNEAELELCAAAYADGYCEQNNLAVALLAAFGRLFSGAASAAASNSFPHVVRAWKKGIIASTDSPQLQVGNVLASPTMWNTFENQKAVMHISPPKGETWELREQSRAVTPEYTLALQYYRIGRAHANAGMFVYELKQPVGVTEFNLTNHMNFARPSFVGEVLWPPAVPSGFVGLSVDGFKFRIRENASDAPYFFGAPQ